MATEPKAVTEDVKIDLFEDDDEFEDLDWFQDLVDFVAYVSS